MNNNKKNKKKDYKVGYGKPPVATRFRKGVSGNPSGRRKKEPELIDPGTILENLDSEEIVVTENGKRRRMTKGKIRIRQLFVKAIKGDLGAARLIFDLATKYLAPVAWDSWDYEVIGETEAARRFGRNWRERVDKLNAALGHRG
jgi:hypothetical protein